MSDKAIGFIGIGTMGGTIAGILLDSHKLRVFDLNEERAARLAAKGAEATPTAGELAAASDIVITCLPRSEDVDHLIFGPAGIASQLRAGSVVIDMTTGDPTITRSIAARLATYGVTFVDASLAGGIDGALAGTLAIYVGADDEVFESVLPVLHKITAKVIRVGPTGCGNVMKLVNNVIGAAIRAVTCEAVLMGVKGGLDLSTMAEILPKGSARSHFAETALPRYVRGSYKQNFAAALMAKDLRIATRLGAEADLSMQVSKLVLGMYDSMLDEFGPAADVDQLLELLERRAGTKITGRREPVEV